MQFDFVILIPENVESNRLVVQDILHLYHKHLPVMVNLHHLILDFLQSTLFLKQLELLVKQFQIVPVILVHLHVN